MNDKYEKEVFRGSVLDAADQFKNIVFIGVVYKIPEKRYTQEKGTAIVQLKVLVSNSTHTMFVDVPIWGEERCDAALDDLNKGSKVAVIGMLTTREWKDEQGNVNINYEVKDGVVLWTPKKAVTKQDVSPEQVDFQ